MRTVLTTKDKRDVLRKQLHSYSEIIPRLLHKGRDRSEHEINVLRAAGEARRALQIQINALSYVLNEDTELELVVEQGYYHDKYQIDHNIIMEVFD